MERPTFDVLDAVYEATQNSGSHYVDPTIGNELQLKGLITLHNDIVDEDSGWIAAQTTDAGNAYVPTKRLELVPVIEEPLVAELPPPPPIASPMAFAPCDDVEEVEESIVPTEVPTEVVPDAAAEAAPDLFAIHEGGVIPDRTRRTARKETYPFDRLEEGDFFFVPATPERLNPAKSLASTVSSAAKRYAIQNGTRTVKRNGADKEVPAYTYSRKFSAITIKQGAEVQKTSGGPFIAPCDGAVIMRVKVE